MKIVKSEIVPIDSIKPNEWNPNHVKDSVYAFLKKSIKKRGFSVPIIVTQDNIIIDGEHRWKAMKELGATEIEVKVLPITKEEAMAETVNFNMTKGVMDSESLGLLLYSLEKEWGKELLKENIVLEQKAIEAAIRSFQKEEPVDMPALQCTEPSASSTTIKAGDIFFVGNHVLMCGDSTDEKDVKKLLGDNKADITITDPPYNVGYEYRDDADDMEDDMYEMFIKAYVLNALDYSSFAIITPGNANQKYYFRNFEVMGNAVWNKGFALTNGFICHAMITEPILFIGKKPKSKLLNTDHLEYHTDREIGLRDAHSCPKPMGLFKELLTTFTDTGGSVLDLFGGSGTTMVVAEQTGRKCYMMEKDPVYCQNIINRFEKTFGVKAVKV